MQLFTTGIFLSMVFSIQAELSSDGENVCLQTETYNTTIEVEVPKQFTEKRKKKCWNILKFFRCEKTVTISKLVKESQVVQRTIIVPKCCDGYAEEKGQVNKCLPVCVKRCQNGKCVAPNVCACNSGFYGSECEKACPENFWGNNCTNECDCSNNGNCDNVSGGCYCDSGWRGKSCELPCQDGFYGYYCKEKCNCDSHICDHKTGECITTTTENVVTVTLSSTTEESTAETSLEIYQTTEHSVITNEETSIVKEKLLFGGSSTVKETSDVTVTLGYETASMNMTEEPDQNEKGTKAVYLEQIPFSRDTEVFETSNSTGNTSIRTSFNEAEKNSDENETNNFISGREKSPSNKKTLRLFPFPPSLTVISSVFFLIFIIAAKWITSIHRKKAKRKLIITGKNEKLFQSEEPLKFQADYFWVNNCTKNPLPEIELNTTPILETFKPVTLNKGFISKEKEIK